MLESPDKNTTWKIQHKPNSCCTHCTHRGAHPSYLHSHHLHHISSSEGCSGRSCTWTVRDGTFCWSSVKVPRLSRLHSRSPHRTATPPGCSAYYCTATGATHTGALLRGEQIIYCNTVFVFIDFQFTVSVAMWNMTLNNNFATIPEKTLENLCNCNLKAIIQEVSKCLYKTLILVKCFNDFVSEKYGKLSCV